MRIKLLFVFSVDEKHLVLPKFWAMECYGWVAKLKKLKKQMELSLSLIHPPKCRKYQELFTLQALNISYQYLLIVLPTFIIFTIFFTNIYWLFYQCLSFLPFFTNIWLIVLPIFTIFLTIFTDCFTNVYHFYHFLPIFTDCFTNMYHFLPIFTNIVACMGLSFFNW